MLPAAVVAHDDPLLSRSLVRRQRRIQAITHVDKSRPAARNRRALYTWADF